MSDQVGEFPGMDVIKKALADREHSTGPMEAEFESVFFRKQKGVFEFLHSPDPKLNADDPDERGEFILSYYRQNGERVLRNAELMDDDFVSTGEFYDKVWITFEQYKCYFSSFKVHRTFLRGQCEASSKEIKEYKEKRKEEEKNVKLKDEEEEQQNIKMKDEEDEEEEQQNIKMKDEEDEEEEEEEEEEDIEMKIAMRDEE